MDVDGSYRGLDHNIHRAEGFTNYTIFFPLGYLSCGTSFLESGETGTQCGYGGIHD